MDGIIVIDKQKGISSSFAVRKFAKQFKISSAGHAGTLDPMATGVLVAGLGKGTRILRFLEAMDKVYTGTIQLGSATDTDDAEGATVEELPVLRLTENDIVNVLTKYTGEIKQLPPSYSAIKIDGKRAYKSARAGETPKLALRDVTVHSIKLLSFDNVAYTIQISVHCSKGTYIRSLARDISRALGTCGHLSSLRRESVGLFDLSRAIPFPSEVTKEQVDNSLISISDALKGLQSYVVADTDIVNIKMGRTVLLKERVSDAEDALVKSSAGEAICIASVRNISATGESYLQPQRMLV
ncbi:MAG: tRNA pseudouridine(55) synthase TruB [Fibrobacteres bacterium]|nr:tRNA pseudouridine(55) synthase TruB [Fibrobacterota bacterium]